MVDSVDVSNDVKHVEVWDDVNAIGRFLVQLENTNGKYSNRFLANDPIAINVNGASLMAGWVDDIKPLISDTPGTLTQRLEITGRNFGRELSDLQVNKLYDIDPNTGLAYKSDDMAEQMLIDAGSHITYDSPSTGPTYILDSTHEFLLNSFRKIADNTGTVNNPPVDFYTKFWGELNLFPAGGRTSGIKINSSDLSFKTLTKDESNGLDIKNYILALASTNSDLWTEDNAADWIVTSAAGGPDNGTVANSSTVVNAGAWSIARTLTNGGNGGYTTLTFPRYGYDYLDFSAITSGSLSFDVYLPPGSGLFAELAVLLFDTNGIGIIATIDTSWWNNVSGLGYWSTASLTVGSNTQIKNSPANGEWGHWFMWGTSTPVIYSGFNWQIAKICVYARLQTDGSTFYIDNLKLPSIIKPFAIAQNAASQTLYGLRYDVINEGNSTSQNQLQYYADTYLLTHKEPLTSLAFRVPAYLGLDPPANNWKPGYNVTVSIPEEGISSVYRLLTVHHIYDRDTPVDGWDHVVDLNLVPAALSVDLRKWEAMHRSVYLERELWEEFNILQKRAEGTSKFYPALPAPLGGIAGIDNTLLWTYVWEAENSVLIGTTMISADVTASEGHMAERSSNMVSDDMLFQTILPYIPATNYYTVVWKLKVTDNSSSSNLADLTIWDINNAVTLWSKTIKPSDFGDSDHWILFAKTIQLSSLVTYGIRITNWQTGVTGLSCDLLAIVAAPVTIPNDERTVIMQ